jgi:hypothetical protein
MYQLIYLAEINFDTDLSASIEAAGITAVMKVAVNTLFFLRA